MNKHFERVLAQRKEKEKQKDVSLKNLFSN